MRHMLTLLRKQLCTISVVIWLEGLVARVYTAIPLLAVRQLLRDDGLFRAYSCNIQASSQAKVRILTILQINTHTFPIVTAYTLETAGDHLLAGVPSARAGTPEDVAGTALYLASRASGYTNGATITIDGGL